MFGRIRVKCLAPAVRCLPGDVWRDVAECERPARLPQAPSPRNATHTASAANIAAAAQRA